jgi:hypothetical protein
VPEPVLEVYTDGVVTLSAPRPGDAELLVEGRDDEFVRWLGPGAETPDPVACILVSDELVGWVDYDRHSRHDWLERGEVNVGYYLFRQDGDGAYRDRTGDLRLAKPALSQLS